MRYLTMLLSAAFLLFLSLAPSARASHGDGYANCKYAIAANIPCVVGVTDDTHWRVGGKLTLPAKTMPWQGNTVATIAAQFPVVINWEFQTKTAATLNAQIAQFSDIALARFSHDYWVESNGNTATLFYYAALKLTAPNLVRLYRAFGPAVTSNVTLYAPAAVRTQYNALAKPAYIKQSHAAWTQAGRTFRTVNGMASGVGAPTIDMTPREIFSEYLWTEAETEMGAFGRTTIFMKTNLGKAFLIGWQIGTSYYDIGMSIDPDFAQRLVTEYGDFNQDFGPIQGEVTGHGEVGEPIVIETDTWCENAEPC